MLDTSRYCELTYLFMAVYHQSLRRYILIITRLNSDISKIDIIDFRNS